MGFKTIKRCLNCSTDFLITFPAQLYCKDCTALSRTKEYKDKIMRKVNRKKGRDVGIGSGNSPKIKGKNHYNYKHGGSFYKKIKYKLRAERKYCERCGVDVREFKTHFWVCHHIDRNRNNSDVVNLMILCKSCHQKEHKAYKNFNK